jgi:hypothetical protein
MEWEEAVIEGIQARQQRDGAQWRLGDLALQIETTYGERTLASYAESIGVAYHALMQYRWVAGQYEKAVRTENLTWSHHERVAGRADRQKWLKAASEHSWNVRQMQAEVWQSEGKFDPKLEALAGLAQATRGFLEEVKIEDLAIEELVEVKDVALDIQNFAIEEKLRAERMLGQLTKEMRLA